MEEVFDRSSVGRRPPTSLRLLDGAVWLCLPLVLILTMVTVVYTIGKGGIGGGNLFVDGWTGVAVIEHTPPSGQLERFDLSDRSIVVEGDRYVMYKSLTVRTAVSGAAPRIVIIVVDIIKVALAWFAWINLRGLTRSSLRGDVFTEANSSRLARLGGAAIVFPISVWWIGRSWFNSVVNNEQVGVTGFWVDEGVDASFLWIGAGLLLLTVSRAFRWGVELQELEAATI